MVDFIGKDEELEDEELEDEELEDEELEDEEIDWDDLYPAATRASKKVFLIPERETLILT